MEALALVPSLPRAAGRQVPACYHLLSAAADAGVDLGQDPLGAEPGCSCLEQGEGCREIPSLQALQT